MSSSQRPAFSPAPSPKLEIIGEDSHFPVKRIFCVGRNYASHAREMGSNPEREPPFFFSKPADSLIAGSKCELAYPPRTKDLHHEVELVIGLKKGGANIVEENALDHVFGIALGLDFTRRDLQASAKKGGKPWDMAKGFDGSAVIGPMKRCSGDSIPQIGALSLSVNDNQRQLGDLSEMIWPMAAIISELSSYLTLQPGDLIFTGTPEGVSAILPGDVVLAKCAHLPDLQVKITD